MSHQQSLMPALVLLFGLAILLAQRSDSGKISAFHSWARVGYGIGKICLLAIPLQWPIDLVQGAEPAAMSAKAVWLICIIRTLQLFLITTGAFDMIIGVRGLLGLSTQEMHQTPARSSSFRNLWSRWLPAFESSLFLLLGSTSPACCSSRHLVCSAAAPGQGLAFGSSLTSSGSISNRFEAKACGHLCHFRFKWHAI